MKETVVLVPKEEIRSAIMQIETMQDEALDNLSVEHNEFIPYAEIITYKANGRLNMLQDLELLTSDEIVRIFTKQSNLEERLRIKKAELKSANLVQQLEN